MANDLDHSGAVDGVRLSKSADAARSVSWSHDSTAPADRQRRSRQNDAPFARRTAKRFGVCAAGRIRFQQLATKHFGRAAELYEFIVDTRALHGLLRLDAFERCRKFHESADQGSRTAAGLAQYERCADVVARQPLHGCIVGRSRHHGPAGF